MVTRISEIKTTNIKPSKLPLVIGYFGSVHVMHSQLLDKYHRYNVLTFRDFSPKLKTQLYTYKERIKNIVAFKPINIFVYDIAKSNMKAEEFIQKILLPLKPSSILVGSDFVFGSDHKSYKVLCQYFNVETINYNKTVSTTIISNLLANKKIERANSLLFTPYYYVSKWVKGNRRGKDVGFRTINLKIQHRLAVPEGSYITKITLGTRTYRSISFVGKSKTFKNKEFVIETYVIGKHIPPKNLHISSVRDNVKVQFLKYLRSNTQFKRKDQLTKAIEKDVALAKAYFERNK